MLKLQCYVQKVCNYFITLRKLKITSRSLKIQKRRENRLLRFHRFKYVKIFKHANLHLRLFRADWKREVEKGWCQIVLFRNGGKYGLNSRSEHKINSSQPDVAVFMVLMLVTYPINGTRCSLTLRSMNRFK